MWGFYSPARPFPLTRAALFAAPSGCRGIADIAEAKAEMRWINLKFLSYLGGSREIPQRRSMRKIITGTNGHYMRLTWPLIASRPNISA